MLCVRMWRYALCENVKVLMNGISEMETPTSLYFFSQALIAGYSIGVTRVNKWGILQIRRIH